MNQRSQLLRELSQEVAVLASIRHGYIIQFYGLTILPNESDGTGQHPFSSLRPNISG